MGGIAQLAKSSGFSVSGCDANVYPPMSTLLESHGIELLSGYEPAHLEAGFDQVVIGNALSRGNPLVESVLDNRLPYTSGPQWLHDRFLGGKKVLAVAGTHGKTTTSAIASWILSANGQVPGYLIGGKPGNFDHSAEAGEGEWFVIEADEYDTAFFDKRSKFVHYSPQVAILNNIEFDHADIFDSLDQIKTQFHHLVRIVPASGTIVANGDDKSVADVLERGCWSNTCWFSVRDDKTEWFARRANQDCSQFEVFHEGKLCGNVQWDCIGQHNMANALAAIAAAHCAGVSAANACSALAEFVPAARRLQLLFNQGNLFLYEDFAHHPTAVAATIDAVSSSHPGIPIVVVIELRSNTMKLGVHGDALGAAFDGAGTTLVYQPDALDWDPSQLGTRSDIRTVHSAKELLDDDSLRVSDDAVIICMSNGGFDGIPTTVREHLQSGFVQNN